MNGPWTIKYNNDTGVNDEGFEEWWEVSNGDVVFYCEKEGPAMALLDMLNAANSRN